MPSEPIVPPEGSRGRNLNLMAINSLNDNYCAWHRKGAALSIVIS